MSEQRIEITEGDLRRKSTVAGDFLITNQRNRYTCGVCNTPLKKGEKGWRPDCDCWLAPGAVGFSEDSDGRRTPVY